MNKWLIFISVVSCFFIVTHGSECGNLLEYCDDYMKGQSQINVKKYNHVAVSDAFLACSTNSPELQQRRICIAEFFLSHGEPVTRDCNRCVCDLLPILC